MESELSNIKDYIKDLMRWSFEAKEAMENIASWHMERKREPSRQGQ